MERALCRVLEPPDPGSCWAEGKAAGEKPLTNGGIWGKVLSLTFVEVIK